MSKRSQPAQSILSEPCVGIFWLFEGKLIIDSTPLSQAESYGDALTHPTGHIDFWTAQQELSALPRDVEYEEMPRGRIGYDKREKRFLFRADKCILEHKDVVRQLMATLNLPPDRTSTGRDEHYQCAKCLNTSVNDDDF